MKLFILLFYLFLGIRIFVSVDAAKPFLSRTSSAVTHHHHCRNLPSTTSSSVSTNTNIASLQYKRNKYTSIINSLGILRGGGGNVDDDDNDRPKRRRRRKKEKPLSDDTIEEPNNNESPSSDDDVNQELVVDSTAATGEVDNNVTVESEPHEGNRRRRTLGMRRMFGKSTNNMPKTTTLKGGESTSEQSTKEDEGEEKASGLKGAKKKKKKRKHSNKQKREGLDDDLTVGSSTSIPAEERNESDAKTTQEVRPLKKRKKKVKHTTTLESSEVENDDSSIIAGGSKQIFLEDEQSSADEEEESVESISSNASTKKKKKRKRRKTTTSNVVDTSLLLTSDDSSSMDVDDDEMLSSTPSPSISNVDDTMSADNLLPEGTSTTPPNNSSSSSSLDTKKKKRKKRRRKQGEEEADTNLSLSSSSTDNREEVEVSVVQTDDDNQTEEEETVVSSLQDVNVVNEEESMPTQQVDVTSSSDTTHNIEEEEDINATPEDIELTSSSFIIIDTTNIEIPNEELVPESTIGSSIEVEENTMSIDPIVEGDEEEGLSNNLNVVYPIDDDMGIEEPHSTEEIADDDHHHGDTTDIETEKADFVNDAEDETDTAADALLESHAVDVEHEATPILEDEDIQINAEEADEERSIPEIKEKKDVTDEQPQTHEDGAVDTSSSSLQPSSLSINASIELPNEEIVPESIDGTVVEFDESLVEEPIMENETSLESDTTQFDVTIARVEEGMDKVNKTDEERVILEPDDEKDIESEEEEADQEEVEEMEEEASIDDIKVSQVESIEIVSGDGEVAEEENDVQEDDTEAENEDETSEGESVDEEKENSSLTQNGVLLETPLEEDESLSNVHVEGKDDEVVDTNTAAIDDTVESSGCNLLPADIDSMEALTQDETTKVEGTIEITSDELEEEKMDDDDCLTMSIVTWNLAEAAPSEKEASFFKQFRKNNGVGGSDLVMINAQECEEIKPRRAEGHRSRHIRRMGIMMLGKEYVPLAIHSLGGIQCALYCHRDVLGDVELINIADVTCGVGNVLHNKGAIGVYLKMKHKSSSDDKGTVKSSRMLLITGHLAAHVKNVDARNNDYKRIISELEAQAPTRFLRPKRNRDGSVAECDGTHLLNSVDHVFFAGDLNYRIDLPREYVEHCITKIQKCRSDDTTNNQSDKWMNKLLRRDQLIQTIASGRAFSDFNEGKVTFLPTFKFDKGTSNYDTSHKQRIPAWTDRILFRSTKNKVRVIEYKSVPEARHSDHRPVFGTYQLGWGIDEKLAAKNERKTKKKRSSPPRRRRD